MIPFSSQYMIPFALVVLFLDFRYGLVKIISLLKSLRKDGIESFVLIENYVKFVLPLQLLIPK